METLPESPSQLRRRYVAFDLHSPHEKASINRIGAQRLMTILAESRQFRYPLGVRQARRKSKVGNRA